VTILACIFSGGGEGQVVGSGISSSSLKVGRDGDGDRGGERTSLSKPPPSSSSEEELDESSCNVVGVVCFPDCCCWYGEDTPGRGETVLSSSTTPPRYTLNISLNGTDMRMAVSIASLIMGMSCCSVIFE
jgi:hypothetical protein